MRHGPIDIQDLRKDIAMAPEPVELNEYEYVVGHVKTTAMLTEKQAQRLGAKPVGEAEVPDTGQTQNREAERMQTRHREADDAGVAATHPDGGTSDEAITKARTARNKRAS
jgi:hypothetical protein